MTNTKIVWHRRHTVQLCGLSHTYLQSARSLAISDFVLQMVPRGLEPRTLRLLAVRSNQLSYETSAHSD